MASLQEATMIAVIHLDKYVRDRKKEFPDPDLLIRAAYLPDGTGGVITSDHVELILGKDHAQELLRLVTQDPEYIALSVGMAATEK
jgi:hypothetical protein